MQPLLSLVIPNYNGGRYFAQCLESVCHLKPECVEVIVMDGGSTDNSLDIIKTFGASLSFWSSEDDAGPADAISKGFAISKGRWLGWLNSDDFYLPDALNTLVHHLSLCENRSNWLIASRFFASEAGELVQFQPSLPSPDYILLRDAYGVPQECTFFSRLIYEKAGGIDTRLKCHFDLDLFLRLYELERPCYSDAVLGCFRQRKDQISRDKQLSAHDYELKINEHYSKAPIWAKVLRRFLHTRFRGQFVSLSRLLLEIELRISQKGLPRIIYSKDRQQWEISCK